MQRFVTLRGMVCSGRGLAHGHLAPFEAEATALLGAAPWPGSLNIALDAPLKLSSSKGVWLNQTEGRMVWQGTLNGRRVLLYRWGGCPCSVVEIISDAHLRDDMQLSDGDGVQIGFDSIAAADLTMREWLGWWLLWKGRSGLYYSDHYMRCSVSLQRYFDGVISGEDMVRNLFRGTIGILRRVVGVFHLPRKRDLRQSFIRSEIRAGRLGGVDRLLNVLAYTKTSGSDYSAVEFPAGYHTVEVDDFVVRGQRLPAARLDLLPISLKDLSVVDIGCNQGGVLFEAQRRGISWGVGVDYDSRMVNAANKMRQFRKNINLDFFVFDLEKEQLPLLKDYLPEPEVDLVLLLSVCMWIENWREVISFGAGLAPRMLFESNGTQAQQAEQLRCLEENFKSVEMLQLQSSDDSRQKDRRLYYCKNNL